MLYLLPRGFPRILPEIYLVNLRYISNCLKLVNAPSIVAKRGLGTEVD